VLENITTVMDNIQYVPFVCGGNKDKASNTLSAESDQIWKFCD